MNFLKQLMDDQLTKFLKDCQKRKEEEEESDDTHRKLKRKN